VKAGNLPPALLGKPVLLLKTGTFAMTPVLQPQQIRTAATIDHLPTTGSLATTYHASSAVDAAVDKLMGERERRLDFVCPAVDVEDETRLLLPQGIHAAALPGPASVITGAIFYRATYTRESDAILVRRRLTVRHGRATCTPLEDRAMRPALERIRRDLSNQVIVSGSRVALKSIAPPARAQPGHRLVRQVEAQVDAVPSGTVAAGPAGDLDKTAAPEKAGRVRMRVDRHVAGPQLAARHMQQPVGQQRAADAGAVAVGPHEAEHERAEIIKRGQFVAAEADDLSGLDDDEQRPVRVVQRGTQP
jgi:hypothetical protein